MKRRFVYPTLMFIAISVLVGACEDSSAQGRLARVVEWSLGSHHRGPSFSSAGARMLSMPLGQPLDKAERRTSTCKQVTSILPVPGKEERVFLLIEGSLYFMDQNSNTHQEPRRVEGGPPGLLLTRLLAHRTGKPTGLLVEGRIKGSASDEVLLLHLSSDPGKPPLTTGITGGATGCGGSSIPDIDNEGSFWGSYHVPRCKHGKERCIVTNNEHGESYLDEEPHRGEARRSLQDLGKANVRDAAWAQGDGERVILLVECYPGI